MQSEIAELFLCHSTPTLSKMQRTIEVCLGQLSDEQVWSRHAAHENTHRPA